MRKIFSRRVPTRAWHRIIGEIRDATSLFNERGWIAEPRQYHSEPKPLHTLRVELGRTLGLNFERVSFRSEYEPHPDEPGRDRWHSYIANRTAHAWVLRRRHVHSWVICIPGYSMGNPYVDLATFHAAWLHNHLGLNVLIPVLPLHGPRKMRWASGDGFFSEEFLDTVHAEAQAVWDIRRLITWIRSQGTAGIGVYGISLGGYTAALLACFEPDLACVIAGIPATDFALLARMHTPARLHAEAEALGLKWELIERLFHVISPLAIDPVVPRENRFVFAGTMDRLVPREHVRRLWRHWERPEAVWYEGSHFSFNWEPAVRQLLRKTLRKFLCDGVTTSDRSADTQVA